MKNTLFDLYASNYDSALNRALALSGEDKNYFARRRIEWMRTCLCAFSVRPRRVMDYGCGTGSSAPFFLNILAIEHLIGTDESEKCLEMARQAHGSERVEFVLADAYQPRGELDLVFCNGVFHHIPPSDRPAAIDYLFRSLRPGGCFAFWENNPWNPGTRYVMSRAAFDRDAITLTPPEARRLLSARGFEISRTDFLFIFPRALSWFRPLEPYCSTLPLGGQYQVLCRKPEP